MQFKKVKSNVKEARKEKCFLGFIDFVATLAFATGILTVFFGAAIKDIVTMGAGGGTAIFSFIIMVLVLPEPKNRNISQLKESIFQDKRVLDENLSCWKANFRMYLRYMDDCKRHDSEEYKRRYRELELFNQELQIYFNSLEKSNTEKKVEPLCLVGKTEDDKVICFSKEKIKPSGVFIGTTGPGKNSLWPPKS